MGIHPDHPTRAGRRTTRAASALVTLATLGTVVAVSLGLAATQDRADDRVKHLTAATAGTARVLASPLTDA